MTRDEFEKWYEENQKVLYATAAKRVGPHDAETAVDAALLGALTTKNYEKCHTSPLTWFLQAVKSEAWNARRSRARANAAMADASTILSERPGIARGQAVQGAGWQDQPFDLPGPSQTGATMLTEQDRQHSSARLAERRRRRRFDEIGAQIHELMRRD